jgi:phosphoribosyl 1,2-cyclic phosphate phosphodiesterase
MKIKFIILGSGYSLGVPRADGYWGKCNPKEKKNYRTRCSAFIQSNIKNIIIDTSPDIRQQLIKNNIKNIDCALFTHKHGDQIHGINDLRVFSLKSNQKIPIYADLETGNYLKNNFSYCFNNSPGYNAILELKLLKKNFSFKKKGESISIRSVPVQHGKILSQSFIINKSCGYVSDVSEIFSKDLNFFNNLKYLVIDCLRFDKHPSHYSLDEIIKINELLKPKKTILTNMNNEMDYNYLCKILPKNIVPGYDGMSFNI